MNHDPKRFETLGELVRARAADEPDRRSYTFIRYRPRKQSLPLDLGTLDQQARAIAADMSKYAGKGDRALLLYRPGLEFITAFLACLYAGVVAVPSSVPRFGLGVDRLKKIARDAQTQVILTTAPVRGVVEGVVDEALAPNWLLTEQVDAGLANQWTDPGVSPEDLAFLQYSSGSTGDPKGIMISHGNLMHQSALFHDATGADQESCFVSWLPTFHDLGLIAGVLQPLYGGYHGVIMAPDSFVEKPLRWLQAISEYRADISAAPNFAYELCLRHIDESERAKLDLSHWRFALNGAEPIRAHTLDAFAAGFASCGFNSDTIYPAYGLAEATLMVTGGSRQTGAVVRGFDPEALEANRAEPRHRESSSARVLVASGTPLPGQEVRIVDPDTHQELEPMQVGEVWIAGDSVGQGYWQREQASQELFQAHIVDQEGATLAGPFMRSGDLGFLCDGELFICGRLKDLILIRGRNHHAPDIEFTVERSHPALRPGCVAAFPVEVGGEERLVVAQEMNRKVKISGPDELQDIVESIRRRITEQHEIPVYAVVLLRHGSIPKTSSGKIQRRECRSRFLSDQLQAKFAWSDQLLPEGADNASRLTDATEDAPAHEWQDVLDWFQGEIAGRIEGDQPELSADSLLEQLPLEPAARLATIRAAELHLRRPLQTTLFEDFNTLGELITYLTEQGNEQGQVEGLTAAELENLADEGSTATSEPIAIVGIGCRFPGAQGPEAFWKLLCDGVDAVSEVPLERWDIDEVYDENPLANGKMNTRCGGFLQNIDLLDRNFFGLSIREAVRMDPQHRLMLETAWEALEDAGIDPEQLGDSSTGVFVGISGSDYAQMQFGDASLTDAYAGLGCALTIAASRVSHFLNLRGPAIAVDTACSSSLSALHLACGSMRRGECSTALVGGVNILLSPTVTMCLTKAGMMSPDGRCKAFDDRANGYVRADGAGMVVLKPLSQAQADGDAIYAVIRGTASNQDGRSSGIAAPNGEAQQRVIMAACRDAGIAAGNLDYVEAHGTGTAVGDPIEVKALGAVLSVDREPETECVIGSVKTNIGHAESAAGVASLIKVALMLKHGAIPPSLHFENPNPLIPFDELPLRVSTALSEMPRRDRPILAGVNGFGVGGTNVHAVLEQTTAVEVESAETTVERPWVLPLSARSDKSLKENARQLADYLEAGQPDAGKLLQIAHTLSSRRSHMGHRMAVSADGNEQLIEAMRAFADAGHHPMVRAGQVMERQTETPRLAYVFSGQGSQWWAMGRELLTKEPVYRAVVERCDALLQPLTGWSLLEVLNAAETESKLDETAYAQPALFALQVGLAALWRSWGVAPDAVFGHSVGEVAAAHVAGALSLEDAVRVIAHRARLMQQATGLGHMANIEMPLAELMPLLEPYADRLSVAAINSPSSIVVSGETAALDALLDGVKKRGVVSLRLPVNYAFHSPQMEPFKRELITALADLQPMTPQIPLVSTVTGDWCDETLVDAAYWGDNMRERVRFADAVTTLAQDGTGIFLEIGPNPVLRGAVTRTLKTLGKKAQVFKSLQREEPDQASLLATVADLYCAGREPDWRTLYPRTAICRDLPSYAWDRQRFWLDLPHLKRRRDPLTHPFLSQQMALAQPAWSVDLDTQTLPFLKASKVDGVSQPPVGLLADLALAAVDGRAPQAPAVLVDVKFGRIAALSGADEMPSLQTLAVTDGDGGHAIQVFAEADQEDESDSAWTLQLDAHSLCDPVNLALGHKPLQISALTAEDVQQIEGGDLYRQLAEAGLDYGTELQVAQQVWLGQDYAVMAFDQRIVDTIEHARHGLHPLMFEGLEQTCRAALGARGAHVELDGIKRLQVLRPGCSPSHVYARVRHLLPGDEQPTVDVWMLDEEGLVLTMADGVAFRDRQTLGGGLSVPEDTAEWLYDMAWVPAELTVDESTREPGTWLIFKDGRGVGDKAAAWLRQRGEHCVLVRPGAELKSDDALTSPAAGDQVVDPADLSGLSRIITDTVEAQGGLRGVLHLWSLDSEDTEATTAERIAQDQSLGAISVVHLIQALTEAQLKRPPRLWVATSAAQPVKDSELVAVAQSPIWGLGKVINIEHPELACVRLDLGADQTDEEIEALCMEIWANGHEDQVAFRGDQRYVCRLSQHGKITQEAQSSAFELPIDDPFFIEWIDAEDGHQPQVASDQRRQPAATEVEIRVQAVGIDQRHLSATERAAPQPAGADTYRGRIIRVGNQVDHLQPGDDVLALARGGIRSHLTLPASAVTHARPGAGDGDDHTAMLSLRPAVAALFALRELAGLQSGEKLLLIGADSTVGEAAAGIARWLGAEVYATLTRQQADGVSEALAGATLLDQDQPTVFEGLRQQTGGAGVDVVMNCVAGFDMARVVPAMSAFARCVDAARTTTGRSASLVRFNLPQNASLRSVDVDHLLREGPAFGQGLIAEVADLLHDGKLPVQDGSHYSAAELQQWPGRQPSDIARLCLQLPAPDDASIDHLESPFRPDASYLVTGGLGGLGLGIARHMAERGARHLVLVARSAPSSQAQSVLDELRAQGVQCITRQVDMGEEQQVRQMLADIADELPPLRGIIHAAGLLENGLLVHLDEARFRRVMPPKVQGAWYLHEGSRDLPLDFFVLFSSLASLIGSPGQGNYSAANAFLDGLADYRRSIGLPGLSICWGPWAEIGMAADAHNQTRLEDLGMGMLAPEKGFDLLEELAAGKQGTIGAIAMNWPLWSKAFPIAAEGPYVSDLIPNQGEAADGGRGQLTAAVLGRMDAAQQHAELVEAIHRAVCQALALDAEQLPSDVSLSAVGLDSIVALELKNRIESAVDVVVQTPSLLKGPSVEDLAGQFREQLMGQDGAEAGADMETDPVVMAESEMASDLLERLDELSDEEVSELLTGLVAEEKQAS